MKYLPESYSVKEGTLNFSPNLSYFEEDLFSTQTQICFTNFSKINAILDETSTKDFFWKKYKRCNT